MAEWTALERYKLAHDRLTDAESYLDGVYHQLDNTDTQFSIPETRALKLDAYHSLLLAEIREAALELLAQIVREEEAGN